jgi:hypothetical protein
MAYTYEELRHKTVGELRAIANRLQHEAVQGYTQMNKEHLLPALCKALGIDPLEHHAAVMAEKSVIKSRLRQLKAACAEATAQGDYDRLHALRREYHTLNHRLRSATRRPVQH